MIDRLLSILCRSRLARRLMVVAVGLVAVSVVASAIGPAPRLAHRAGPASTVSTRGVQAPPGSRHPVAVSAGELARARDVAARFLAGYVPFIYGRGSARSVVAVTPSL